MLDWLKRLFRDQETIKKDKIKDLLTMAQISKEAMLMLDMNTNNVKVYFYGNPQELAQMMIQGMELVVNSHTGFDDTTRLSFYSVINHYSAELAMRLSEQMQLIKPPSGSGDNLPN